MIEYNFFNELSIEEQMLIKSKSKYIEMPANSILFFQGDICADILLLQEGSVNLYISKAIDERVSLYEITKGEQCIINTSSALSNSKAIATAETTSNIKAWLVPQKVAKELMISSASYQEFIFSLFSLKFSALTTLIEDIKFKRLDQRVLDFLNEKKSKNVEITHELLATQLSTSRVVISRVLKDLENQKYIKLHRKRIEILN